MFGARKNQEPGADEPNGPVARPGAFLGTLRSEFDEPEEVPGGFRRLQENVETLLAAYDSGRLSRRELAERLSQQRATDNDGGEWTLGATTKSWYRRQGPLSMWMQVPPPSQAIGEPRPGTWQGPIELPEVEEQDLADLPAPDAAHQVDLFKQDSPVVAPGNEMADFDADVAPVAPERTMEFPAEYVPGSVPAHTSFVPASYDDNFDSGLAALLAQGLEEERTQEVAPVEEAGPAPRAGSAGAAGPAPRVGASDPIFEELGLGGYLDEAPVEEPEGPGSYLGSEDAGLPDDYLYESPATPASSYGDFLDVDEDQAQETVVGYLDGGGSVTGPGPLDSGIPAAEDRDVDTDPSAGAGIPETPAADETPAAPSNDDFFLPEGFFWDEDKS